MAVESSTPIPTADGWKRACDLSAKDVVFDQAGAPQPVLSVQSWIPLECYEVHMDDGLTVVGDRNLAFPCQTKNWREHFCRWFNRKSSRRPKEFRSAIWDGTVREILTRGLVDDRGKTNFSVGATGPVQFPTVDLPVPPYVFGLWLGTRTPTGRHWLRGNMDLNRIRSRLRGLGFALATRKHKNGDTMLEFRPSVTTYFAAMGVGAPDELPFSYLMSSPEQRSELLAGLVDARDVFVRRGSTKCSVQDPSWRSIRRKQALLESLGFKTRLHTPSKSSSFSLFSDICTTNRVKNKRFIVKIDKKQAKQCVHVACERPFLVGEGFIAVC